MKWAQTKAIQHSCITDARTRELSTLGAWLSAFKWIQTAHWLLDGINGSFPCTAFSRHCSTLRCNRFQRKRRLPDKGGAKGTDNLGERSFWFHVYFKMTGRFDLCGKLIRFMDCSRYSSGNSECCDPQNKTLRPHSAPNTLLHYWE